MSEDVHRVHVIFHGFVQGVGFRYTAKRAAAAYKDITGFVRNLGDGTVEFVAEGPKSDLENLLSDISTLMAAYITNMPSQYSLSFKAYDSFTIEF